MIELFGSCAGARWGRHTSASSETSDCSARLDLKAAERTGWARRPTIAAVRGAASVRTAHHLARVVCRAPRRAGGAGGLAPPAHEGRPLARGEHVTKRQAIAGPAT